MCMRSGQCCINPPCDQSSVILVGHTYPKNVPRAAITPVQDLAQATAYTQPGKYRMAVQASQHRLQWMGLSRALSQPHALQQQHLFCCLPAMQSPAEAERRQKSCHCNTVCGWQSTLEGPFGLCMALVDVNATLGLPSVCHALHQATLSMYSSCNIKVRLPHTDHRLSGSVA